jgi:hypothetical protein
MGKYPQRGFARQELAGRQPTWYQPLKCKCEVFALTNLGWLGATTRLALSGTKYLAMVATQLERTTNTTHKINGTEHDRRPNR